MPPESVPQGGAPAPGTPEHDAAMAQKFADAGGQTGQGTPPEQTPAPVPGLPEKFKTVEDLVKAYGELEAKLGSPKKDAPPDTPPKDPPKTDTTPPPAEIDVGKLSDEVAKDGKLSDESLQALQAKGYSQAEIDAFVAGQVALAEKAVQDLYALAGGEETFNTVQQWATSALTQAEKDLYHEALQKDEVSAKLAIHNLVLRYQQQNGTLPARSITATRPNAASSTAPFASIAEQNAAIRDPRYSKDTAYRAAVEKRIMASSL